MDVGTGGSASAIVSSFPPPPPYYMLFRPESDVAAPTEPPQRIEGSYPMFGQFYTTEDILPTLESEGRQQLYPKGQINLIEELKKLNKSLIFKFLELVDYLIANPSQYKAKVDDIELIVVNMHHLLNSYRPHQARQILISLMEEQIKRRAATIENTDKTLAEVKSILDSTKKTLVDVTSRRLEQELQNQAQQELKRSQSLEQMNVDIRTSSQANKAHKDMLRKMATILDTIKDTKV